MPRLDFPQYLRRQGITLLYSATPEYIPGALLRKKKQGYMRVAHIGKYAFKETIEHWPTVLKGANIAHANIVRKFSLGAGPSLNDMGVTISAGLERTREAKMTITGIKARYFDEKNGARPPLEIDDMIQELKRRNKRLYRRIRSLYLIGTVFYATDFTMTFDKDVRANVEAAGPINVSGSGGVKWVSKRAFKVSRNDGVPFGFKGWQISKGLI